MGLFGRKNAKPADNTDGAAYMRLLTQEHAKGVADLRRLGFSTYAFNRFVVDSDGTGRVVGMSGYVVNQSGTVYELVVRIGLDGSAVHSITSA